jgi:hypothetical protein
MDATTAPEARPKSRRGGARPGTGGAMPGAGRPKLPREEKVGTWYNIRLTEAQAEWCKAVELAAGISRRDALLLGYELAERRARKRAGAKADGGGQLSFLPE